MKYLIIIILSFLMTLSCSFEPVITAWDDGKIPYFLKGDFSSQDLEYLDQAMSSWESVCGVKFYLVEPKSNAYEIRRVRGGDWTSTIGENNVICIMDYPDGTTPVGHLRHELGHCLGLIHEHQRPDRDKYVTIRWKFIKPEYWFNFEVKNNPLITEENYEYDFGSIMHYYSSGFSINGENTIIPVDTGITIARSDEISPTDILKAREIYGLPYTDEK